MLESVKKGTLLGNLIVLIEVSLRFNSVYVYNRQVQDYTLVETDAVQCSLLLYFLVMNYKVGDMM